VQRGLILAQELLQINGPCICKLVTHRYRWTMYTQMVIAGSTMEWRTPV